MPVDDYPHLNSFNPRFSGEIVPLAAPQLTVEGAKP